MRARAAGGLTPNTCFGTIFRCSSVSKRYVERLASPLSFLYGFAPNDTRRRLHAALVMVSLILP